jgi:hypothetical protein
MEVGAKKLLKERIRAWIWWGAPTEASSQLEVLRPRKRDAGNVDDPCHPCSPRDCLSVVRSLCLSRSNRRTPNQPRITRSIWQTGDVTTSTTWLLRQFWLRLSFSSHKLLWRTSSFHPVPYTLANPLAFCSQCFSLHCSQDTFSRNIILQFTPWYVMLYKWTL